MRLARKFTSALLLGMCLVLMVLAYRTARREIDLFESDMRRDHLAMGRAMANAVERLRRDYGEDVARDFVSEADGQYEQVRVRWVRTDALPGSPEHAGAPAAPLMGLRDGRPLAWVGGERLYTYVPLRDEDGVVNALELSESLAEEHSYVRTTILRILVSTGIIVLICGGLAWILGYRLVGRPVHELVEKARRAGGGDFGGRIELPGRDELSELGDALNSMCAQLAESLEQLRRADRLLTVGKLAAGIAHELGTPLNVVRARAKMISTRSPADLETAGGARIVIEQCDQMTKIIRQLLDFARPRTPHKIEVDLCHVLQRSVSLLEAIAAKRNVKLQVNGAQAAVRATVDPDQLQQVLSNLIINGIQAMPKGGTLTAEVDRAHVRKPADQGGAAGEFARLRISDEGIGIPPEHLDHLFEPFFTTKDVGEGTGLGLSVSRGIIREHGGWIDVRSQVGRGSCFSVYLPENSECAAVS